MRAYLQAVPLVFSVRVRELLPAETVGWQFCVSPSSFLELNRQVFVTKRGARHLADYEQSGSQFLKSGISNNTGPVNPFFPTPLHALREERHFALVEGVAFCFSKHRLARNQFQVRSLDPTHASLRSATAIMITTSNSSVKRSGTPNQYRDVLLHTIAWSGLSRVRTEFHNLLVIPSLAHHPKQTNR